jgi:hypothetical protein
VLFSLNADAKVSDLLGQSHQKNLGINSVVPWGKGDVNLTYMQTLVPDSVNGGMKDGNSSFAAVGLGISYSETRGCTVPLAEANLLGNSNSEK